jgi:hypothetical protein
MNYYITHSNLGTWNNPHWKELLKPVLQDDAMKLAYD